ncbi:hypothetical protein FACS1894199_14020 [Bacteroidia bacterium]|nr:hypothetical protein FACS1894199_14020 [Bacteroidia bacterium]
MEKTGLLDRITLGVENIAIGRKELATVGAAEAGLASFMNGLLSAQVVFTEVYDNVANDIESVILVEQVYLTEERRYCRDTEKGVTASMTAGIVAFDDALRALEIAQDAAAYRNAEATYSHLPEYRYRGMPKDAFHVACLAATTRLNNTLRTLRTPGINGIERQIYDQRSKNMSAAQGAYLVIQQSVLAHDEV